MAAGRRAEHWPWIALALLLIAGGGVIAYETRGTTFFQDEWAWILGRRGDQLSTLLTPHNAHLSLVPVLVYKLLFATAGMAHYWPYRAYLLLTQVACVTLIYLYARPRVGPWAALLPAAAIMFFGPGWQDILWPFQAAWVISVAAGIAALIALDGAGRRARVAACVLLAVSLASAGPGLAVAAGMIVEVAWRRPRRELWIPLVPLGLYAIWWLAYQQASVLSSSIPLVPRFVFDSAAGVLSSLPGLAQVNVASDTGNYLQIGPALVVLAVGLAALRIRRWGQVPPRAVTLSVITLAFWVITGLARANVRVGGVVLSFDGDQGRYLYVGAVWIVLLAVELCRGLRIRAVPLLIASVLTAAAVISNFDVLREGGALLRSQAQITNAELGTLNMTRDIVPPSFASNGFTLFAHLTAGGYFAAERELGSSAATPAQIASGPPGVTAAADAQLIRIHSPTLIPSSLPVAALPGRPPGLDGAVSGPVSRRQACLRWSPAVGSLPNGSSLLLTLPSRGVLLRAGQQPATISLRRFSAGFSPVGTLAPRATARLHITADDVPAPWHLEISSSAPVLACAL